MSKKLIKKIIQKQVWTIKKKSVVQVLTPRCRRDGEPEYGRFTIGDIERIIQLANSKVVELTPYFMDLPNIGNYGMAYSSMIDLAIYRALLWEKVDPGYATNLIGDINWQFVTNTGGYYRLKRKLISLKTKEPMERMGIFMGDMLKFPYSKPGYRADAKIGFPDRTTCPVRPEGHPERTACELYVTGRAVDTGRPGPTWYSGGSLCKGQAAGCENHPENQYQLLVWTGGTYRACGKNGVCGEVVVDK